MQVLVLSLLAIASLLDVGSALPVKAAGDDKVKDTLSKSQQPLIELPIKALLLETSTPGSVTPASNGVNEDVVGGSISGSGSGSGSVSGSSSGSGSDAGSASGSASGSGSGTGSGFTVDRTITADKKVLVSRTEDGKIQVDKKVKIDVRKTKNASGDN